MTPEIPVMTAQSGHGPFCSLAVFFRIQQLIQAVRLKCWAACGERRRHLNDMDQEQWPRGTSGFLGPRTEQFALGSLSYLINYGFEVCGNQCLTEDPRGHGPKVVDLLQNMEFPKLDGDPRIDNIINKCWHNKYATVGKLLRVRRRCSLKNLRPIVRAVIMWIKTKILWRKISLPKGHSARNWWSADFSTCSPRESLSILDVLWIGIDILLSRVDWTRFRGLRLGGEDGGSGKMFVSSKGDLGLENNVNNG